MFQEFFAKSELLFLPLISMGIFFVTFVLVVTHVVVGMRKKDLLTHVATLPLDDEGEQSFEAKGEGRSS